MKMKDRYLYKAKQKDNGEWATGSYVYAFTPGRGHVVGIMGGVHFIVEENGNIVPINEDTLCQCTGLKDKNDNLIYENDILMCHGNKKDIVKVVYGKFAVIDIETLEKIDNVIGWHYEVIQTDTLSKLEPFNLSMPLTDEYIKTCEFEVIGNIFDNPELLESEEND